MSYQQIDSRRLDATFAALSDPTRRAILGRLAKGETTVSELAKPFKMSQPAVSKHLKVLERAGLISYSQIAQSRPRKLEVKPLKEASVWLEEFRRFWEVSFGRLDSLLEELKIEGEQKKGKSQKSNKTTRRKKNVK